MTHDTLQGVLVLQHPHLSQISVQPAINENDRPVNTSQTSIQAQETRNKYKYPNVIRNLNKKNDSREDKH